MNENRQTIQAYEGHVQEYIDGSPDTSDDMKRWLGSVVEHCTSDARILEIGSADGRDAEYLQSKGFSVECTDGTQAFVDLLHEKGLNARKLDLIADPITDRYDAVIAKAVLLHFTREQTRDALAKVLGALGSDGVFGITLKEGDGEAWSDAKLGVPRYFCYWRSEQIRSVILDVGYKDAQIERTTTRNAQWLEIIARK